MMRPTLPVLFRAEDIVPTDWTTVGTGIRRRIERREERPGEELQVDADVARAGMCDWTVRP